jgi:23S rRNA (adenine2030-N6)-methyltransferase
VDSSFDRPGEFERLKQGLVTGHDRWATGTFALWYPLMEPPVMHAFERSIIGTGIRKILKLELSVLPARWTATLRGCGMLIINPPFGLNEEARPLLAWLWRVLSQDGEGGYTVSWLAPE